MCCFCSFQRPNCADLRVKRAQFAAFKKVMSFVFKYSLASFPLFLCFVPLLQASHSRTIPNLATLPLLPTSAWTCWASKSSNSAFNARIRHSIWVRFRFVFQPSSFVFKYFLASFPLFFIFCISPLRPLGGTFPPILARQRSPALASDNVST